MEKFPESCQGKFSNDWEVWIWPKEHQWPFYPARTLSFPKDSRELSPSVPHLRDSSCPALLSTFVTHEISAQPYTWLLRRHVTCLLDPRLYLIQKNCLSYLRTFKNVIFLKLPYRRPWSQKLYLRSFGGKCLKFLGHSIVAGMRYSTYPREYHLDFIKMFRTLYRQQLGTS